MKSMSSTSLETHSRLSTTDVPLVKVVLITVLYDCSIHRHGSRWTYRHHRHCRHYRRHHRHPCIDSVTTQIPSLHHLRFVFHRILRRVHALSVIGIASLACVLMCGSITSPTHTLQSRSLGAPPQVSPSTLHHSRRAPWDDVIIDISGDIPSNTNP